jgi:anthraniloyl-CoA monooxygenase
MNVNVLGAGPAGLYLAILLKKNDPRHHVRVVERNAPDATFGFGVVFSEGSLDELEHADYESYVAITESFASWNPLDVRYRGTTTRIRGNVFSGIARKELLRILEDRAGALGVEVEFQREVSSLEPYLDADLVVGADGANSLVRRTYADQFRPALGQHPAKYAWFGADLALPVFTYIFKETDWGVFQAHCYPYEAHRSTMVVLVSEATWRRSGLDEMDEAESLAFTQAVFRDELGAGHRMLANRSLWLNFPWIACESWHTGNVVILGDAAHTAHFSIGSGTKLALEDAVALARAFARWKDNRQAALTEFEMERQPVVERLQEASRVSADYFASLQRYFTFEPLQFAYQLMTRTPRITHNNLSARDAEFVRRCETWFWARATGATVPDGRLVAPPPAFAPLALGAVTLSNRLALAPVEGWPDVLGAGAGLVITPLVAISEDARIEPGTPLAGELPPAPGGAAEVMVSIGHAGRRGAMRPRRLGIDRPLPESERWPLVSASTLAYAPWTPVPVAADPARMAAIADDFVATALRVRELGYRMLELDFSRGMLPASFISPLSNQRTDEYGGSLANRLRYPLAVLAAVRGAWTAGLPLAVAYSAADLAPGGLTPADSLEAARRFREGGADLIRVLTGQTVWETRPDYGRTYGAAYSDRVRNECDVPTIAFGQITTVDEVNTLVAAGRADLCILDR